MQLNKFLSAKSPALVKMEIKPSQMEYKKLSQSTSVDNKFSTGII